MTSTGRLKAGWDANDPLLPVSTGTLARQAGYVQFWAKWMPTLRKPLIDTLNTVGVEKIFARNAAEAPTADGATLLPWTLPLHRSEAAALIGIVRTAAIVVLAAASGMRASELMELRVGCRRVRGTGPRPDPLPASPASSSKASRSAAPTTNGSSSSPSTRPSDSPSSSTTTRVDGDLLFGRFSFELRYQLVPRLGQRPGRAPARTRPDPRQTP